MPRKYMKVEHLLMEHFLSGRRENTSKSMKSTDYHKNKLKVV